MTERQRRHVTELLPLIIFLLAAATYIVLSALDYGALDRELRTMNSGWRIDGEAVELLPSRNPAPKGGAVRLSRTLEADFDEERGVCFYSVYQTVSVRLDGEEIYRFDRPSGERLMRAAPSYWNRFVIPTGSGGAELEIELQTPYHQYENVLPEIRVGDAEQIERFVSLKMISRFAAALAVLFIGLIFSGIAVVMRYYVVGNTGLYTLSLFIIVLAIFLAAQQTTILLEIYSGISYITLQSVAFVLCPVLYTRYLMRVYTGRTRAISRALYCFSIISAAIIIAMQIFGYRDMPQMMSHTRNLCAVIVVFELLVELQNRHRLLVCVFALLMGYAVFLYYFTDTITWLAYAGVFAYLFILLYRVISAVVRGQVKQIRLEAALEVSRSEIATIQITSHFFYHTLDSIRALIRLDADRAYKMTGDFAKYIRHRVDGVEQMQDTIPFSRELRSIRAYTDIKQAQLGARFDMQYDIEAQDFEILPLTVQPLVENAVVHAVQKRRDGGWVRLRCWETKQGYHIEVIDNGAGSSVPEETMDIQKGSTAVKNVNTRLEYFGIPPLVFEKNEYGGITAKLDTPKKIKRKGTKE